MLFSPDSSVKNIVAIVIAEEVVNEHNLEMIVKNLYESLPEANFGCII